MDKTKVNLYSWNRFISRNLVILPELLGKELEFSFEDYTIKIKLPGIKDVDRGKEFDSIITVGARRASDNEPLEYDVIKVDVKVIKPLSTMVPSEALKRNANAYELFSQKEQERLNKVVEIHKAIAERAFEYWMRILRWKCDDSRLGRPEIHDYQSGWSTYLYDLDSGKKLWIEPGIFHVRGYGKVDSQKWIETVEAIQSGLEPPIYIEFKHAAERNLEYGDLNGAFGKFL